MKITDLKTYVVANPPPHRGGPYFVFLKLITDDGLEGFGEAYGVLHALAFRSFGQGQHKRVGYHLSLATHQPPKNVPTQAGLHVPQCLPLQPAGIRVIGSQG